MEDDVRAAGFFAAAMGGLMLLMAGFLLARATKQVAGLMERKRLLEAPRS